MTFVKFFHREHSWSVEWTIGAGGYSLIYFGQWKLTYFDRTITIPVPMIFIFKHCFYRKGLAELGGEREFTLRFETRLENTRKYSWFTFEAINPYEARWFYLMMQVWTDWHVCVNFNFGKKLSLKSKKFLKAMEIKGVRDRSAKVITDLNAHKNNNGNGGKEQWRSPLARSKRS